MYKVKNLLNDVRKFWDGDKGIDIYVEPEGSVFTNRPPKECGVWEIEKVSEQKVEKKKVKSKDKKVLEKNVEDKK